MRHKPPKHLELCRITQGPMASAEGYGMNGAFILPSPNGGRLVLVISDGSGWDHVSVDHRDGGADGNSRCPTWEEMCYVRQLCFLDDEWAIQYMPPASDNINVHPYTLHMWRPQGVEIPKPPKSFI